MEQVYIFDFGDKIKAGYSTDVEKRLRTIELSSGVEAKQFYAVNAGRAVEKILHNRLENRLLGEFFAFPFDKAKEILDEIMAEFKPIEASRATARQSIEMALAYKGIPNAELARRLDWSPQLLNKRLTTGKFTVDEWEKIADAIGAEPKVVSFRFPDGMVI